MHIRLSGKEGPTIAGDTVVLVNTNEMRPRIAPIALDYIGGALAQAGREVQLADLSWAEDAAVALANVLRTAEPRLVAVTFRNSDDCFWPSAASFVPRLVEIIGRIRSLTDAPVVLGGAGLSVFPEPILEACGCEFGVRGEGEVALVRLLQALESGNGLDEVPGLVRRAKDRGRDEWVRNPLRSPADLALPCSRDLVDNPRYFREGGQAGVETKRGCDRACTYCADPVIKGACVRTRSPAEVADEVEALLRQGIDVLHLCDSEFNVPPEHALAVCRELVARGLGGRVRWYTYAAVSPFSDELAHAMRRAGCVGVNFGADSANAEMLRTYGRRHTKEDIFAAIEHCRRHGIRVMIDLLLGGPGETEVTVRETIEAMKQAGPDCVGAALGVRLYPGTSLTRKLAAGGDLAANPHLRRKEIPSLAGIRTEDSLPAQLLQPTFYISRELGENPAGLVVDMIGGDERFFEPIPEQSTGNYNYNENLALIEAIANGARGAYWDILSRMKGAGS